ncbi:hypothetical protein Tco_0838538 [Tanacetum coccineum]|uniref:Uncharacterized protein n=1 Tax=Tanacetum coccineum TaxID=301880 RepID=A0ABQ5AP42_9ASTR
MNSSSDYPRLHTSVRSIRPGNHELPDIYWLYFGFLTNPLAKALVVSGGVDVDCCGGGVKDGNDCGIMVEYTSEESVITEIVWGISEKVKNLNAKSDE